MMNACKQILKLFNNEKNRSVIRCRSNLLNCTTNTNVLACQFHSTTKLGKKSKSKRQSRHIDHTGRYKKDKMGSGSDLSGLISAPQDGGFISMKDLASVRQVDDLFTNPIEKLQKHVDIPILSENEIGFNPTRKQLEDALQLFSPSNRIGASIRIVGSWPNPHIMPQFDTPEIAFIGKSNVGKSSLLKSIFRMDPLAKVRISSNPGHTKLMNVFNVFDQFHLVDMPGYGFNMPDHFEFSVEAYLKTRRSLSRVFMLVDGSVGPTDAEMLAIKMMEDMSVPYVIVLTKIDNASDGAMLRNLMATLKFKNELQATSCFPQPFLVSALSLEGIAYLQAFIGHIAGFLQIEEITDH